ncbi:hypothetical protein OAK54_02900 [Akkermansiaceae bacterium]|nr:hypothetical protein [Akkermansiaceae bacterium]
MKSASIGLPVESTQVRPSASLVRKTATNAATTNPLCIQFNEWDNESELADCRFECLGDLEGKRNMFEQDKTVYSPTP